MLKPDVLLQICARISLEKMEEVCWELFHQHCWMIQILIQPVLQ